MGSTLLARRTCLALPQLLKCQQPSVPAARLLGVPTRSLVTSTPLGYASPPSRRDDLKSAGTDGTQRGFKDTGSSGTNLASAKAGVSRTPQLPAQSDAWVLHNPVYTAEEVNAVKVVRQVRTTKTDKIASFLVAFARWGFDFVTRYKHASPEEAIEAAKKAGLNLERASVEELRAGGFIMTETQWLNRIIFLESIAGVPGMVGAMAHHLTSLRLLKHDPGFINSLLQEAENERMHLMTFMEIKSPGRFFRALILLTQGVFFNAFFLAYLISPRAAHRFVGYLEEEACLTYTQVVSEINKGHIPEWAEGQQQVPQLAINYWRMDSTATMLDLILAVRADESSHRFVNHSLANLKDPDFNPFGVKQPDAKIQGTTPGFSREQCIEWYKKVEQEFCEQHQPAGDDHTHVSKRV